MASGPQSAGSARQEQQAAQTPAQAAAQPDLEAAQLAAPVAHASNGVRPPSSTRGPERLSDGLPQAAAAPASRAANGVKPTAAALAPAAETDAFAGSERGGGSAAASDAASDSTAVSTTATAGSSRASALSGMPDSSDFQALSGVLRQVNIYDFRGMWLASSLQYELNLPGTCCGTLMRRSGHGVGFVPHRRFHDPCFSSTCGITGNADFL